ncbi:MAG TPA: class I SAM-dependent methyltransferase [Bacteroidales bacterium]|nr:class I SAM-dependent methyltransferase [Bacteroidales bacterium]
MNKIQKRYDRIAGLYDILEAPMEHMFSKWRTELLSDAAGKTLEVGIGTGKNLPYYPENVQLTGIDFSPKMIEITNKKLREHPRSNTRIIQMDAEKMEFADSTFDTVVTSCVFCSVPNAVQGLKEIRRVCRKDGKVLMLEHVRSQNKVTGKIMDIINPIPVYIYGANINRRTYENLIKAGFDPNQIEVNDLWFDIVKLIRIKNTK